MLEKRIKELRLANEWTQEELANKLSIAHSTVSAWERGVAEPSMGMLEILAQLFKCSKSYLIGDIDTPKIRNDSPAKHLTDHEQLFLNAFRAATEKGRMEAYGILIKNENKKDTSQSWKVG